MPTCWEPCPGKSAIVFMIGLPPQENGAVSESGSEDIEKKKLAGQIHARAFQIGTHAPLGEFDNPVAARKNISGFFIHNGNIYWNLKKEGN